MRYNIFEALNFGQRRTHCEKKHSIPISKISGECLATNQPNNI